MIWNDATNVIWNGSTVNAVICNGAQIWPNAEPTPDAWTMFAVGSAGAVAGSSQIGFDIFDSTHRKVYSTEGLHDVSSYNSADAVASGIAPFYVSLSGSGCPYNVLAPRPYNVSNSAVTLRQTTVDQPGSLITVTAQIRDSKTNSSDFPATTSEATNSNVSRVYASGTEKLLELSGNMVANWLPVGATGSASGVFILTTFDNPLSGWMVPGSPFNNSSTTANIPGLADTGTLAGYFRNKTGYMQGNPLPGLTAFNFLSGINHSGLLSARITNPLSGWSAVIGATGWTGSLFANNVVSGEYPNLLNLSGKNNFQASAHAIAKYNGTTQWDYYRLTDAQCSAGMYFGYYGTNPSSPMYSFSKFVRTATTSLQYIVDAFVE